MLNYDNDDKWRKLNDNIKVDFFIVEQIVAFTSGTNLVGEGKNLSPHFKRIA